MWQESGSLMGNSAYKLLTKALFFSVFLIFISLSPGEDSFTIVFLEQSYIRFLVYGISFLFLILFLIHNGIYLRKRVFYTLLLVLGAIVALQLYRSFFDVNDFFKILILLPFLFIERVNVSDLRNRKLFFAGVFAFFLLFSLLYGAREDGRLVYNFYDPNYSAIYVLFAFLMAQKMGEKTFSILFLILGILTFSRNFILAILVFYIIRRLKQNTFIKKLLLKIRLFPFFIITNITLSLIGFAIISLFEPVSGRGGVSLNDGSNRLRFTYAVEGVLYSISGREALLLGAGDKYWPASKGGTGKAEISGRVHNSFLDCIAIKGTIYTLIYVFFIFSIVKEKYQDDNYEYVFSFLFAMFFLGDLLGGLYVYCWCFILSLQRKNNVKLLIHQS